MKLAGRYFTNGTAVGDQKSEFCVKILNQEGSENFLTMDKERRGNCPGTEQCKQVSAKLLTNPGAESFS